MLSTRGTDVFGGLGANGPITEAVRSIGFDEIYEQHRIFDRDFPSGTWMDRADRLGEPAFGDTLSILASVSTNLGPVVTFVLDTQDDPSEVKVAIAGTAGEPLEVSSAISSTAEGARAAVSLDDGYSMRLPGLQAGTPVQLEVELASGASLAFEIEAQTGDGHEIAALSVAEHSTNTFTAGTERFAYAADIEKARLMQALKWGTG
jgi:hypothetical protein